MPPSRPPTCTILDPSASHGQAATALGAELRRLGIELSDAPRSPAGIVLSFEVGGLTLRDLAGGGKEAIRVDFGSEAFIYRLQRGGGRRQPLGRAVGLRPGYSPTVLDATAGLGRDGFLLAALGCQVTLCERSAIVHALLRDGLERAAADARLGEIVARITLARADSRDWLARATPGTTPEVIYLDPMFPHRSKSALVKKEMRLVRAVVGDDTDIAGLLPLAIRQAGQRVVCKRPLQAPPLTGPSPDFAITTPKHRFDVYLTRPQAEQKV